MHYIDPTPEERDRYLGRHVVVTLHTKTASERREREIIDVCRFRDGGPLMICTGVLKGIPWGPMGMWERAEGATLAD